VLLCFFNLLPIPPLDGSQVVRSVSGMTYQTYHELTRYGYFILIIALQIPIIQSVLNDLTLSTCVGIGRLFGIGLG
jgi:Zn-dependent protease